MYGVVVTRRAQKAIGKIRPRDRKRIGSAIDALAKDPRPRGAKKLSGTDADYRIRVGDYRVLYEIRDDEVLVLVFDAGHRRDVYE